MRVWLIKVGETLPLPGTENLLMRMGELGKELVGRGHDVTWWASTFSHLTKENLADTDITVESPSGTLRLLQTPGYRRHLSVARWRDHRVAAARFLEEAEREARPDVILCALPTLELCAAAVEYGQRVGVPVLLDIRDWHPDLLEYRLPKPLRPVGHLALSASYRSARHSCSQAYGLVGITDGFLQWGLEKAGRRARVSDAVFPLAPRFPDPSPADRQQAQEFWNEKGVSSDDGWRNAVYFGSITPSLNLSQLLTSAHELRTRGEKVRIIICGTGDTSLERARAATEGLETIMFPGWVNQGALLYLLSMADVGLNPMADRPDFSATFNNKAVQYLSQGVPILAMPKGGVVAQLIEEQECGFGVVADGQDLTRRILELTSDPQLQARYGANARQLYESRFAADRVYAEFADYLETIAKEYPSV